MPALEETAPEVAHALASLRAAEASLQRRRSASARPRSVERAVLRHVVEQADADEPATPSRIAELAGLTRPTVSVALRRLEEHGLVRRQRHARDGRRRIVVPAPHVDLLAGDAELVDDIRAITERLTSEQAAFLVTFLEGLRRAIDEVDA
ncbi:hypothetical protein GCM10009846_26970 [Agrococcus versicolor]|uniref:MarR family transcriptional regulator n=1 Tax=Agrococcus versicolor TaxID=501482 RepID=A0ABP5MRY2_9MICO